MKKSDEKRHIHCCVCGHKLGKGSGTDADIEIKCPICKSILDVQIVDGSTITTRVIESSNKAS